MPIAGAIRVTEPLDFFKMDWYTDWVCRVGKREANRIKKESMAIGSAVDECIKTGQVKVIPKYKVEIENCLKAYKSWKEVYQPKEIVPGTRLFAEIDGVKVTGEPDLFVDGVLVDIKCAKKISLGYWIQVCMYKYLQDGPFEHYPVFPKVAILRLCKITGSFQYEVRDYDPKLVNVWIGLMKAYVYFSGEQNEDLPELQ